MNLLKYITCFLILLTGNVYSKNLPPGSGSSVPANILIMLDRTFSMYQPAIKDAGVDKMFNPMAIAQDPISGHYFAAQVDRQGVVLWDASTSTKNEKHNWGAMKKVKNNCGSSGGLSANRTYDIFGMEVYENYIYTSKIRLAGGKEIAQFDARVTEHLATGNTCKEFVGKSPELKGFLTIDIQNGIFYSFSKNAMYAKDLSINPILFGGGAPNANVCSSPAYHSKLKEVGGKGSALAVDNENNFLYLHNRNDNKIYSFEINSSGCVDTTERGSWTNPCGTSFGMAINPTDSSILYSSGRDSNKICKMKLNSSRDGIQTSLTKMVGIGDAYETSVAGSIYFYKPLYLAFDDSGQLLVANSERIEITVLDKDLNFVRVFGLSGVSRLRGAVDAITAVVSDSALTEGALFGLGLWSKDPPSSSFTGWNTSAFGGKGAGEPCNGETCLLVKIDSDGAAKINDFLKFPISLFRQTDARGFAELSTHYLNSSYSPIDTSISCQSNYIIVIGDGGWKTDSHSPAMDMIKALHDTKKVKSIMVAYGNSLKANQLTKFNEMAVKGGTGAAIVALTANDLKVQLQSIIATIIAENLSYTAPAITGEIETGGSLYQAQFDYFANQEWQGSLKRTKINADGNVTDTPLWNAKDELPTPDNRKIWSIIPGTDYKTNYNNFTDTFASIIHNELFQATGNTLKDYHNDSDANKLTTGRCGQFGANNSIVVDGIDDEITGLINFIRGEDYFDFDGDCDLTEPRSVYLADIYNSQIVVVGKPEADTGYLNNNQEAYWRSKHGYQTWKDSLSSRMEVVYAGANNGILHAFNAQTGKELWGFVPPLIAGKLPLIINSGLNKSTGGGSVPIFAVDGSPVVHDMYFISPLDSSPKWHTIMMIPYGRGGAGFSVLDITDPNSPLHLYSILNDPVRGKVHHVNHIGEFKKYDYQSHIFEMNNFKEVQQADQNYEDNASVSNTCNNSGSTSCYEGTSLTLNEVLSTSLTSNAKVFVNGSLSSASFSTVGSTTQVNLGENITYNADPNSSVLSSTVGITIINPISSSGIDYNYRFLAETWSSPRIFRLPNHGAGDTNDEDDIYVAVMGGGYGVSQPGLGSNLLVINLDNGKLLKQIDIADLQGNGADISGQGIINSVPSTPVVITADTSTAINFRGALVYVNDLEGKITKINLSNMEDDGNESATPTPINLYDQTTLFTAGSTSQNNRYMFHSMDATIGNRTNDFWLFAGTGNFANLNDAGVPDKNAVDNLLIGIKDKTYPKFRKVDATGINGLTECNDTTNDSSGANCPEDADLGWYIKLDPSTTSARKKVTAEPTVSRGVVYFPIYKPNDVNICNLGDAFICAADDECGTNRSSELGTNTGAMSGESCLHVGNGALSKIVVYGNHLYANIAGETTTEKDLVIITAAGSDMSSFRLDWRENF